jgi:phosphonate transport system ATP-binding protein
MAALRAITREDGITVICNLHTLDMARPFCDRIVGMADGKVVFDGPPAVLSTEGVREIYGVDEAVEGFHEVITSFDAMVPGNREAEPTPAMRRSWLTAYGKERGARCLLDERRWSAS